MDEVDLVLGNEEKLTLNSYRMLPYFASHQFEEVRVNDIMEVRETASHMVDAIEGRARAFVQVQNGCASIAVPLDHLLCRGNLLGADGRVLSNRSKNRSATATMKWC